MRLLGNARNNASQLQQQLTLAEINTRNSTLFVRLAACKKQVTPVGSSLLGSIFT